MMEKLKKSGLVIMYLKMSGSHLEGIREKKSQNLSLLKEKQQHKKKVAVKVVDIFGNDTMRVIEVQVCH